MIVTSEAMTQQHEGARVDREDSVWLAMDKLMDMAAHDELAWRYVLAAGLWRDAPGFVQQRFAARIAKREEPIRLIEVWDAWLTREEARQ